MQIDVQNPGLQTIIFGVIFVILCLVTIRVRKIDHPFDLDVTNELKGFAILAIIFSHIGYFLSKQDEFLFPLSIIAGVGVNLFLFLSGAGLTFSSLKSFSISQFYKKRLLKLFIPMWIVVTSFLLLDKFGLNISYSMSEIISAYFGFFPKANLYLNIDSPLWYFSLILFYYLTFPLFFWKRFVYLGAILLFIFSWLIFRLQLPMDIDVISLYKLHLVAFPLGMIFATLINQPSVNQKLKQVNNYFKIVLLPILLVLFTYTSFNSGVGQRKIEEELISLITMFCLIIIFMFKTIRINLFYYIGIFSYEIYLIHWPIVYRYDFLYKYLPASIATLLYLAIFLAIAWAFQKLTTRINKYLPG